MRSGGRRGPPHTVLEKLPEDARKPSDCLTARVSTRELKGQGLGQVRAEAWLLSHTPLGFLPWERGHHQQDWPRVAVRRVKGDECAQGRHVTNTPQMVPGFLQPETAAGQGLTVPGDKSTCSKHCHPCPRASLAPVRSRPACQAVDAQKQPSVSDRWE